MTAARKETLLEALGNKRMAAILLLGFASGLPFNLTGSTLQAWLASAGMDIKTIGLFGFVGVPYAIKFLWAPFLDRFLPPLLGRRRGWILIYQALLAVFIGALGFNSPTQTPYLVAMIALAIAFLSASQDIVIDAYRADVVKPPERALAASVSAFGFRTAAMIAGAFVGIIADHLGWRTAYEFIAVLMAMTMIATLWAREPDMPSHVPKTLVDAVVHPLLELIQRPGAWAFLLLVLLYKVGDAFALSLYSAFMIKGMHFTLTELSIFGKINMTISTMIGTALGGWWYLRWGLFRCLLVFGVAQAFTNLLYMCLALSGKVLWLMILATSVDNLAGGMGQAAFVAFLMSQCSANFSGTQYALLSALAAVPRNVMGYVAGHVVDHLGWANFFIVTFLTAMPGLALLLLLRRRINAIEA